MLGAARPAVRIPESPATARLIDFALRAGRAAVDRANVLLDRLSASRGVRIRLALRRRWWWGNYRSRCGRSLEREYRCVSLLPWLTLETWRCVSCGPPTQPSRRFGGR